MMNYEFLNGLCSSRENKIISSKDIAKMLDMSYEDALHFVKEKGFGGDNESIDDMVKFEESEYIKFIKDYAEKQYLLYKLLPYDFKNAEGLFKSRSNSEKEKSLIGLEGIYKVDSIREFLKTGKGNVEYIKNALSEAIYIENMGGSSKDISHVFVKNKYSTLLKVVKDKDILDTIKKEIDYLNLSTMFRSNWEDVKYIIDGGYLSCNDIKNNTIETSKKLPSLYKDTISKSMESIEKGLPLVDLEKERDNLEIDKYKRNKYLLNGRDKFRLYNIYRKREIENVRVLLVGLASNISKDEILKRIRSNYDG